MFFSMIGICSAFLLWPLILALYFTGAGKECLKKFEDSEYDVYIIFYNIRIVDNCRSDSLGNISMSISFGFVVLIIRFVSHIFI